MIHGWRSIVLSLVALILLPGLSGCPVSANTLSVEVIAPPVTGPGDLVWFEIVVTNLAPIFLDHANYGFTVSPFVDLIRLPWGDVDESSHMDSFWDCLAAPPSHGTSRFFADPILGHVRHDTPPDTDVFSTFWIQTVGDEKGPDGGWCYGCWQDYAASGNITTVVGDPVPVPELPAGAPPAFFLAYLIAFAAMRKGGK